MKILFMFFIMVSAHAQAMGDPTFLPMNTIPASELKPGVNEMKETTATLNQVNQPQRPSPQEQQEKDFNLNEDQKRNQVKPNIKE